LITYTSTKKHSSPLVAVVIMTGANGGSHVLEDEKRQSLRKEEGAVVGWVQKSGTIMRTIHFIHRSHTPWAFLKTNPARLMCIQRHTPCAALSAWSIHLFAPFRLPAFASSVQQRMYQKDGQCKCLGSKIYKRGELFTIHSDPMNKA